MSRKTNLFFSKGLSSHISFDVSFHFSLKCVFTKTNELTLSLSQMCLRTSWSDFYTGNPTNTFPSKEYLTGQTPSGTSVYVSNSLFRSIVSSVSGCALYCSSVTCFLLESTSFFSCRTSSYYGGTVFIKGDQCVFHKVCGYDCYSTYTDSTSYDQFARTDVKSGASSKNYVNYSSIVRCVNEYSNSIYTMRHHYGYLFYPSVNMSMNKLDHHGIVLAQDTVSNTVTCSLTYSTFVDNIATGYSWIYLFRGGTKYEMKSCNILRNTQGSLSSYGTIRTDGELMIENSCILENNANCIFYSSSSSSPITLSNCTVDSTSNNGYLTTKNRVTKSFILALDHISTLNCNSEYDSAGTLTPIIYVSSTSKKQLRCYTCYIFFFHPRLSDVVSLHNILIFNFIHPYSS
jgi:hypothetical protein